VEVDETRAGDLDARYEFAVRQRRDDCLREVARLALRRLGELQRDVLGKVAMGRIARAFDRDGGGRVARTQFFGQGADGVPQQFFDQVFQGFAFRARRQPEV
jgi:hypothetical protein